MPRVKRGTKRNDRRKKILKRASGYFLTKSKLYQAAQEAVERGLKFAYSGRRAQEAAVPLAVDCAHRRRMQAERNQLLAVHQWTEEGRDRVGSKGPGRYRCEGPCGLYKARGAGDDGYSKSSVTMDCAIPP